MKWPSADKPDSCSLPYFPIYQANLASVEHFSQAEATFGLVLCIFCQSRTFKPNICGNLVTHKVQFQGDLTKEAIWPRQHVGMGDVKTMLYQE